MSITKENELEFFREFASHNDRNDSYTITFDKDGIEIDYDRISWDDIKSAHKKLFGTEMI